MATSDTLTFQIKDDAGCTMTFKMNYTDPILKAINTYVDRNHKDIKVSFLNFLI